MIRRKSPRNINQGCRLKKKPKKEPDPTKPKKIRDLEGLYLHTGTSPLFGHYQLLLRPNHTFLWSCQHSNHTPVPTIQGNWSEQDEGTVVLVGVNGETTHVGWPCEGRVSNVVEVVKMQKDEGVSWTKWKNVKEDTIVWGHFNLTRNK